MIPARIKLTATYLRLATAVKAVFRTITHTNCHNLARLCHCHGVGCFEVKDAWSIE